MKTDHRRETLECRLKILSPVHVGCDAEYEPMGFCVDEEERRLIVFDPGRFMAELAPDDKAALARICRKGTIRSILELYQFLRGRRVQGRHIDVCRGFIDHYRQTLALDRDNEHQIQQELNRFTIARTAFTPHNQQPYIPGSAIKGALRTGYLSHVAAEKDKLTVGKWKFACIDVERKLLDSYSIKRNRKTKKEFKKYGIEPDPFRLVKISDFRPKDDVTTKIVYAVNAKKKPTDKEARGPFQILEVVESGAEFWGTITVEVKHPRCEIKHAIRKDDLMAQADRFFAGEQQRETKELRSIGSQPMVFSEENRAAFLRVGRHSGAECVSLEGYRNIKIMQGPGVRPRFDDHATTLWLASEMRKPVNTQGLRPFGWAVLTDALAVKQETAEAEKQHEAERQRQAQWEAMSPEERDIAMLQDPDVSENDVVALFNRMDQFSDELKPKLARLLKDYWTKQNKWDNKKNTAKQKQKVAKVKDVLGETETPDYGGK